MIQQVPFMWESAFSSLDSFVFPYWKELPMFWDALVFMIAKGVACTMQSTVPMLSSTSEDSPTPVVPVTSTPAINNSSSTDTDCNPSTSQNVPCSSQCPIVYTHVHNLSGVIESWFYMSKWEPPTESTIKVLGIHAVKYLETHGYVESTIAHIVCDAHYCMTDNGTMVQLHNCEMHNCTTAQL
ncbi:hypothetical protein EDD17DRAFT_1805567 [Pisolithus thermaeus]|nr:hypothetical protein EDD17DRAFT_1805567 [Pisolithus thermaeus]